MSQGEGISPSDSSILLGKCRRKDGNLGGTWVAQSVKHLTLAQVCGFEYHNRLCADSLEPVLDSVSPSLCPTPAHALSLSQK